MEPNKVMTYLLTDVTVGSVAPVVDAAGNLVAPEAQQIGNNLYKSGTVGNKFAKFTAEPMSDMGGGLIIINSISDVFTDTVFLDEHSYSYWKNLKESAQGKPFRTLNRTTNIVRTTVDVQPFYFKDRTTGLVATDSAGNIPLPRTKFTITCFANADGTPSYDVVREANRRINFAGIWAKDVNPVNTQPIEEPAPGTPFMTGGTPPPIIP